MRTGIGIAVLVAIGLIWSVAVVSQWVPVASPEMKSAALIQPPHSDQSSSKINLHRGNGIPRPRDRPPKIAFRPKTVSAETET